MNMPLFNVLSMLTGILVLAACVLLWLRHGTLWTGLALAGQVIGFVSRIVLFVPDLLREFPALQMVWPVGAMLFALGLVGHAWTEYEAFKQSGNQGANP